MMSDALKRQWSRLEAVASIKNAKSRKQVLEIFCRDPAFVKVIREISKNTLKKNIAIKQADIDHLKKYKRVIVGISAKKLKARHRKRLAIQSGGFLPFLIPIIASALGNILKA